MAPGDGGFCKDHMQTILARSSGPDAIAATYERLANRTDGVEDDTDVGSIFFAAASVKSSFALLAYTSSK
jgi:hypothetical protein